MKQCVRRRSYLLIANGEGVDSLRAALGECEQRECQVGGQSHLKSFVSACLRQRARPRCAASVLLRQRETAARAPRDREAPRAGRPQLRPKPRRRGKAVTADDPPSLPRPAR